ncbi:hypothetical protein CRI77_23430 [Mycolicibacterium duvalii]|uniref:Uncharacterized protein n=1 Tax=Mycolicibacterium duvalii TaxID=39688 RepID=A0A7I7JW67_9MYCO|nr:hypothetical protein [Mycolicibacterium duvalii]MCV7365909.1 hypothetical protein [Mycolicibacterium duvalii]PEG36317.1 hypothetical protein CRI77_23430 [Mycolicibacterium duvalii]BBX15491.1 hypothetical protein MDUV_03510 [Mycolicibacterium duvalii]
MSYRLDVVSDSLAEAVAHAGGLIFDRRRAGWDVSVTTSDVTLTRALTILGARIDIPGPFTERRGPHTVVWSAATFARSGTEPSLTRMRQVLLWGHHADDGLDESLSPAHHTLSSAARAFKRCALQSVGLSAYAEPVEHFWAHRGSDVVGHETAHPRLRGRAAPLSPRLVRG